MNFSLFLFALSALVACAFSVVPLLPRDSDVIVGEYIVVFRPEVSFAHVRALAAEYDVKHSLQIGGFKAFGGKISEELLDKLLTRDDLIKYIEPNKIVRSFYTTQNNATWGLDRIDQRALPLNSQYSYYDNAGAGVDAYIIDTGVLNTHEEFEGRSVSGYDFHNERQDATDDNGHGTHVASTVGGKVYGVAKKVRIIGVKTLGRFGAGSLLNVARGVEWAAAQHNSAPGKKSVANMSLGGGVTQALDDAVIAAIEAGLTVVIASGNSNVDACNTSPARVSTGITVNAANINDARASFSNFGSCTHIFAPGQDITGAWIDSNTSYNTISGTSMAAPHTAGAVAVLLSQNAAMTPAEVKKTLLSNGTPNVISDIQGSPNVLLYSPYQ